MFHFLAYYTTYSQIYDESDQEHLADDFDNVFCAKYKEKFNKTLDNCLENSID